ncbi:MAG: transporter substrate-binding protein [Hyphomicrobiales bacterium]|nr:transporter substrate-binding protein [Hyphomicrobiales bacterium]
MRRTPSGFAALLLACAATLATSAAVSAQSFPDRPVKLIVPTAAGGAIDGAGRILAQGLSEHWGKPVVVENRAGASMAIGAAAVAQATPDGLTLLVAHDGVMAINPLFIKNLGYDPRRDFAGLGIVARLPLGLFVHESVPAKSVSELVAYAKANPGKLNHGSGGPASLLALELFKAMAGVNVVNVNFRGSALSINDLVSGNVQVVFADVASAGPAFQSPNVRTLGVSTLERTFAYPNVPTINEAGVKDYATATWIGAFAPAGAPPEIVAALEAAVMAASKSDSVRKRLSAIGMEPTSIGGKETQAIVIADSDKWARLVREQNVQFGQ